MRLVTFYTALFLGLNSSLCVAQELEEEMFFLYGDEEIVSIATGHKQLVSKAPAVASVIDGQMIKQLGATDIDEVLETVPGLHVARDYIAYNPIYTFRGIYADFNPQVLFLVDGVPFTSLFHGDRHLVWGGFPVESIARIEVIRGPGSSLYGADAFAGVINVITRDHNAIDGGYVGSRAGSFQTREGWGGFSGEAGEAAYWLTADFEDTDGQDSVIVQDSQTMIDFIAGTNASLAPGEVNLARKAFDVRGGISYRDLTLRVGMQERRSENGVGLAQALDPVNVYESRRYNADLSYDKNGFLEKFDINARINVLRTTQEIREDLVLFPPGSTGPYFDESFNPLFGIFAEGVIGNPEVFEEHVRASGNLTYHGFDQHKVTLGAGYYLGEIYKTEEEKNFGIDPSTGSFILPGMGLVDVSDTPFVFLPEDDRENSYLFVQDVVRLSNDWELTAGVRYDHYSDFGDTVNPRLALVWSTRHNLTTKLLYGEAFRAPSFAQTRVINNPLFWGNPDLDPETLRSYELAFDYQLRYNLELAFNTFYYEWKDIIQFVSDDDSGIRRAQNAGEQDGYGFELEANWEIAKNLSLRGNYAFQRSTDKTTDEKAANSPAQQLYMQVNWDFLENWSLNLQGNWVMDRSRAANDIRDDVDNYLLTDLTIRRKNLLQFLEVSLLVKNVFDEDAREPSPAGQPVAAIPKDLPLPGRTVFGELRLAF